jgi:hypothetical protein
MSDAGIPRAGATRPAVRHVGSTDNGSTIAWAAVMRAGIAKFVFASSPVDHQTYRHPFTDRHLLPGLAIG